MYDAPIIIYNRHKNRNDIFSDHSHQKTITTTDTVTYKINFATNTNKYTNYISMYHTKFGYMCSIYINT